MEWMDEPQAIVKEVWRFLTDRRDAPILVRIKTAQSKTAPVNAFRSVDHNIPADLESCHATIVDLSPRCIAA